jgi:hypothetical protein
MDYSDLEHVEITDEQYRNNLLCQYPHLDETLSIDELEKLIDENVDYYFTSS